MLCRVVRMLLGIGATAAQVREAFQLAEALSPWDTAGRDDYELKNIDSIKSRALNDALSGRKPCPIWGHNEPEQGRG